MLNNPALDVAIGLVFIFAIYSLLATTLTELVSTLLNQRGKVLREGLIRMLDTDQKPNADEENKDKLPAKLSSEFLKRPEIKYLGRLSKKNKQRLPSYIKPKTFVKGLLNTIGYVYSENTQLKELKERLNKENDTHKFILNLIDEAENNVERFKSLAEDWFNETMDRVAGWYKRRIQVITLLMGVFIAYALNVNTIEIARVLGKDEKARLAMVEAASSYISNLEETAVLNDSAKASIGQITNKVQSIIEETSNTQSVINLSYPSFNKNDNSVSWWSYLIGCFVTAIALSIGSPFWFDLLNKLIKLRGAGTQEKSNSPNPSKDPVG